MARENNFLLGNGERLTTPVAVPHGGGSKEPPYDFVSAKRQVSAWATTASKDFNNIPSSACPNDQVTATITMHPRYISKSDFPIQLMDSIGLKPVGGKSKKIIPNNWGIKQHPDEALTDQIFVMGTRKNISRWAHEVSNWTDKHQGAKQLQHIEEFSAYLPFEKVRTLPEDRNEFYTEVVLHESTKEILERFEAYALECKAKPIMDRIREAKGLTFVPVYVEKKQIPM
jgi:hypothetical protein